MLQNFAMSKPFHTMYMYITGNIFPFVWQEKLPSIFENLQISQQGSSQDIIFVTIGLLI